MFAPILRASVLATLLLALSTNWLSAQTIAPKTYAILVGIDQYPDAKIKPRAHAEADVKALQELILSKDHLGADPKNVYMLVAKKGDKDGPATRTNILAAFDDVVAKAGVNDLVLFAFFGQGCPLGEHVGFFGTDGTAADRAKTALDGADIAKKLESLKSQRFCAFIDVNLNDFENAKDAVRELDLRGLAAIVMGDQDVPAYKRPRGRAMFIASNGLTATVQLEKNSLFAQTLIDGLKGKADKDGYEPDGVVTVPELVKYVDDELNKAARTLGKTKDEKAQTGIVLRNPPTHFIVGRTPAAVKTTEKRLADFRAISAKSDLKIDVTTEGERLLGNMPAVKYQQELRKAYQKLADSVITADEFLKNRDKIIADSRLTKVDAQNYATRVGRAIDMVQRTYFRDIDSGDLAGAAVRGLFENVNEPVPADLAGRLLNVKGIGSNQITSLLADAREYLGRREDLENLKAEENTIRYVFSRQLDRYSYYVDADVVRKFTADTSGNYTGIGVQIRRDPAKDLIVVITPIKGSPAYKAGVQAGDWIKQIKRVVDSDGKPLAAPEVINGEGLPIDDAIKKIVGNPNTKVTVVFEREGESQPIEVELTRARITTESVFGVKRKKDDTWDYMLDKEKKIGYARLGNFADNTHEELERAVDDLRNQGMKAFVLDLRFCPGGKLNTAYKVADLFIKNEMIVGVRYRGKAEQKIMGKRPDNDRDFPMAVLINRNSASASELVSACWQDHKRAVLVGDRTFGKGTVATYFQFQPTGGILNIASASFWRPNGKNLEKITTDGREDEDWGVQPNEGYRVKLGRHEETALFEHMRKQEIIPRKERVEKNEEPAFNDVQLAKALEYVRGVVK
jgi:C-terminal peptidase prc